MRQAGQNYVHVSAEGASPDQQILAYMAIILVLGILLATLVGLALGALGGAIGKSTSAPHAPAPYIYQESMYPGNSPAPAADAVGAVSPSPPGDEKL